MASTPPETANLKPETVREKAESVSSDSDNSIDKQTEEPKTSHNVQEPKKDGPPAGGPEGPGGAGGPPKGPPFGPPPGGYPGMKETIMVMSALMLAIFLMALDRTIIATAVPQITNEFNSLDDIGWYGSAFMLTACAFQLLLGRIYTFFSPKYVFLTIILIFEIGSAICGAAPNSIAFIIGRAIAGAGSAGIMSGAIVLMLNTVPLQKRPMYQGFFGACFGISSVIGPLMGGAFTTNVTWRWCFYINLPIGAVAMAIIAFILKPMPPVRKGLTLGQMLLNLDLLGELFLLPSIVCLLLALQWGGSTYAWSDGRIIALFVVFGVTFIAFVLVQIFMQKTATIPASIIKNRNIVSGMWFTLFLASSMTTMVYFIPIWFQAVKGTSAVKSGIDTIPLVLSLVLGSISAGQLVSRIGYYTPFAMASSVFMPIGTGLITTWEVNTGSGMWIGYQILFGFGIGVGMQQGSIAAQTVLNGKDIPTGVALMFFCQQFGGAIFVSVAQNLLSTRLVSGLAGIVDSSQIVNTGATDLRKLVPAEDLDKVLTVYNGALKQVFIMACILACLTALGSFTLQFKTVRKGGPGGPPPGKGGPPGAGGPPGEKPEQKV